jgi:hypothetical protein
VRRAFTAIEVILALSLLVLMVSLFVINVFQMEGRLQLKPVTEQIQRAVGSAHWNATVGNQVVFLTFNSDGSALDLHGENGDLVESFPLPKGSLLEIRWFSVQPEISLASEAAFELAERPNQQLLFTRTGSTPFIAEIEMGSSTVRLRFDPFSGQILEKSSGI